MDACDNPRALISAALHLTCAISGLMILDMDFE